MRQLRYRLFRRTGHAGVVAAALALVVFAPSLAAESGLEYRVKAAFLFNFARFVEWPSNSFDNAAAPLHLCVLEPDPFGTTLDQTVADKTVDKHPLLLRRTARLSDTQGCHILFVSMDASEPLPEVLGALENRPILTVSEGDEFLRAGGIIGFVLDQGKVRFHVNLQAADGASLKISSKLLNVASRVYPSGDR